MENSRRKSNGFVCKMNKTQLNSIVSLKDDVSAMLGVGDNDDIWIKHIKNIERFLKNNGFTK